MDCMFTKGTRACVPSRPTPSRFRDQTGPFDCLQLDVKPVSKLPQRGWLHVCGVVSLDVFILMPRRSHVISLSPVPPSLNQLCCYANTDQAFDFDHQVPTTAERQEFWGTSKTTLIWSHPIWAVGLFGGFLAQKVFPHACRHTLSDMQIGEACLNIMS